METNDAGQLVVVVTADMIGTEPPSKDQAVWPKVDINGRPTTGSRNVSKHGLSVLGVGKFVIVPVEFNNYVLDLSGVTPPVPLSALNVTPGTAKVVPAPAPPPPPVEK